MYVRYRRYRRRNGKIAEVIRYLLGKEKRKYIYVYMYFYKAICIHADFLSQQKNNYKIIGLLLFIIFVNKIPKLC